MPRKSHPDTDKKIRRAVALVTAQQGISALSMGDVAKAAQVSPGTLYLRFENKQDMLQKTYLEIKRAFHEQLTEAASVPGSRARIRGLWQALFAFVEAEPDAFLFIDNAGAAQLLTGQQEDQVRAMQGTITTVLEEAIADGTLAPIPVKMAMTLLVAPAMHLARSLLEDNHPIRAAEVEATFERVWLSIRAG